jgi:transcriptional regulator with XRE-family HTH domain
MATTKRRSPFGDRLRAELDRQNLSVRGLARKMNPNDPETPRRALNRFLNGHTRTPTPESLDALVAALGEDSRERLNGDDEDDEESDELATALIASLRRIIEAETRRIRKGVAAGEKA